MEPLEVCLKSESPLLAVFLRHRSHEMPHRDLAVLVSGPERRRSWHIEPGAYSLIAP
jgi:hypothetical protein